MGAKTGIEWTDVSWNPWQGCHKVSAGCKNCYMFREKTRFGQEANVVVRSKPHTFNLPLRLKDPQLVFTCSWSDFFIEEADPWRAEAWEIIRRTPHLTYQIVTKRIERAGELLPWGNGEPWPNVWLIVSAENQVTLDERLPKLLALRAVVKGLSLEPLLGPLSFEDGPLDEKNSTMGKWSNLDFLQWVIVGGESGPGARPMDVAWARKIVRQCGEAEVACFVKQLGANVRDRNDNFGGIDPSDWPDEIDPDRVEDHVNGYREEYQGAEVRIHLVDRKGGDPSEWPIDLRVRQFPKPNPSVYQEVEDAEEKAAEG